MQVWNMSLHSLSVASTHTHCALKITDNEALKKDIFAFCGCVIYFLRYRQYRYGSCYSASPLGLSIGNDHHHHLSAVYNRHSVVFCLWFVLECGRASSHPRRSKRWNWIWSGACESSHRTKTREVSSWPCWSRRDPSCGMYVLLVCVVYVGVAMQHAHKMSCVTVPTLQISSFVYNSNMMLLKPQMSHFPQIEFSKTTISSP